MVAIELQQSQSYQTHLNITDATSGTIMYFYQVCLLSFLYLSFLLIKISSHQHPSHRDYIGLLMHRQCREKSSP